MSKMAKFSILIALLPYLLCGTVQGQSSSCSKYFTYINKPGVTDILAQIEIPPPSTNDVFYLKVALNTATELPVVRLELARSIQESILAVNFRKSLLYHVYFPIYQSPPAVSAIWFNNQQYCPSPQENDNITATIELAHVLYPPNEETLVNDNGPWQQISHPWHRNFSMYRIDNPSYDRLNYESEFKCGITSNYNKDAIRMQYIHINGEKTLPGQWPWLVAIYSQRTDNESSYNFECAGTILTTRHIITEKFCILTWKENFSNRTLVELQGLHVSVGNFISREGHENHTGIVNRVIVDYKVNDFSGNRGLAILILKTAVEYNDFIRPVCLWSGSTNLQDTVNMTGYVVGWGHDTDRFSSSKQVSWDPNTKEPRIIKLPLRELSERAAKGAIKELVSPEMNDNNPCNSGSGLVVFNIHTGRFELRGVAYSCHPVECNIEYIDIVNHISWIRHQISNT